MCFFTNCTCFQSYSFVFPIGTENATTANRNIITGCVLLFPIDYGTSCHILSVAIYLNPDVPIVQSQILLSNGCLLMKNQS